MPLVQISERILLLPGVATVGVVDAGEGRAILIDTGLGDRSGKRILRSLDQANLRPVAILNTHSHGDHCGGNAHIVELSGARVCAPAMEADVIERPAWGIACAFGGAEPVPELALPRYAPRACQVDRVLEPGAVTVAGVEIVVTPLPGHSPSHAGYLVDGILFTGDAVASEKEQRAMPLSFAYSIGMQIKTLQQLASTHHRGYVLGHGGFTPNIDSLAREGLARIQRVLDHITSLLIERPAATHEIIRSVCDRFGINPRHIRDYYFLSTTVHAYLSCLSQQGISRADIADGELRWKVASPTA